MGGAGGASPRTIAVVIVAVLSVANAFTIITEGKRHIIIALNLFNVLIIHSLKAGMASSLTASIAKKDAVNMR
ncbi:hypothetical protein CWE08_01400 [Aliidiomarina iranensis]|uniref:Uncharacterized protein n=1 Tax=Aliidiomarina iranensis TaxID=1434071 RepID=A0A432W282_9GAMM|nr:hypothetical protein CWE08_01400 [Aliidiomarina iranensis]